MRRTSFVAAAVLAPMVVVGPMFAGTRIQMENTDLGTNKTTTQVIMMDNTRLRVDSDANTSMMFLTDGGRNRMVILDRAKNTYQEIDEQMMKQMAQMASGAMAQMEAAMKGVPPEQRAMMEKMLKGKMPVAAPVVKTVYTAKGNGTVNAFSCTKYEGVRGTEKVSEVCAASPSQIKVTPGDYQVFEKMKEFTASLQDAMKNSPIGGSMQTSAVTESGISGFPVQTISFRNGQAASRMEMKSITNPSFSDADFSLGSAKKIEMAMPGGRGR